MHYFPLHDFCPTVFLSSLKQHCASLRAGDFPAANTKRHKTCWKNVWRAGITAFCPKVEEAEDSERVPPRRSYENSIGCLERKVKYLDFESRKSFLAGCCGPCGPVFRVCWYVKDVQRDLILLNRAQQLQLLIEYFEIFWTFWATLHWWVHSSPPCLHWRCFKAFIRSAFGDLIEPWTKKERWPIRLSSTAPRSFCVGD